MSPDPEITVKQSELDRLRRKAVDHDHYLRSVEILQTGAEAMREEAAKGDRYAEGWLACLRLFRMTVLEATRPEPPSSRPSASATFITATAATTGPAPTQPALTTLWFLFRDLAGWLRETFGPLIEAIILVLVIWWLVSAHLSGIPGCSDPSRGLFNCP